MAFRRSVDYHRVMRATAGSIVIAIAVIHSTLTLIGGRADLAQLLDAGLVGAISVEGGPGALPFWSLVAGVSWAGLGATLRVLERCAPPLPASFGVMMAIAALACASVAPIGGFWTFLFPAIVIFVRARRARTQR